MSFIHDALKKTQENLEYQNIKKNDSVLPISPAPQQSIKTAQKPKAQIHSLRFFILLSLLIVLIIVFFSQKSFFIKYKKITPPLSATIQKLIVEPIRSETPTPSFVVSGIMMIDNKQVALINNEIHHVGDIIKNGKIIEITLEKVVLELNGEEITLAVGEKY